MKIKLTRLEKVYLQAQSSSGNKALLDGSPEIGGQEKGMRPMELFLSSLAGCASMDVIHILTKGRHEVESFEVDIDGERTDEIPAVFRKITLNFRVKGSFSLAVLERAVQLSVEKYCSVASMLKEEIQIHHFCQKIES